MDYIAVINALSPCYCGNTYIKELKPYGIESAQCGDCHDPFWDMYRQEKRGM